MRDYYTLGILTPARTVLGGVCHSQLKLSTDTPFELRLFRPSIEGYHRDTHMARKRFGSR